MNTFRINSSISEEDYFEFNRHHLLETPVGKKAIMFLRLVIIVAFLAVFIYTVFSGADITMLIVEAVLSTVVGLVLWFNAYRIILGVFRLEMKLQKDVLKDMMGDSEISFDFNGGIISDISPKEEVRVRFENVTAVYETDKAFYVYYNNVKAFVIPYRAFSSAEEFRAFQTALRSVFTKTAHYPTVR